MNSNSWAKAVEPRKWNYWSRRALEPGIQNKRSHHNKKCAHRNQSGHRSPELGKGHWSNEVRIQKINIYLKIIMWFLSLILGMYLLTNSKIYYFIPLRKYWIKISKVRKFPHGPVVKISPFHCRVSGSIPTQQTKTLEAESCGQKRKKEKISKPDFTV